MKADLRAEKRQASVEVGRIQGAGEGGGAAPLSQTIIHHTLLENSWKFLISVGNLRHASKVGENKIDWKLYYNNGVR